MSGEMPGSPRFAPEPGAPASGPSARITGRPSGSLAEDAPDVVVLMYSRPGCHLCDEARERILALRSEVPGLELRELDIERDDGLLATYLERIPVVEVAGEIVSELRLDVDALRCALLDTVRP